MLIPARTSRLGARAAASFLVLVSSISPAWAGAAEAPAPAALASPEAALIARLRERARALLDGCAVKASDGTLLYTPDGKGNYRALWTRDFAYMLEGAGDLIPLERAEAAVRVLVRGVRADGVAPDRVRPDLVPVYAAGPESAPVGEPNLDNGAFLVIAADLVLGRSAPDRRRALFAEWADVLERALDWVPRSPRGTVWNDLRKPHSPYGFTDCIGKTGDLFFESVLLWTASLRLAALDDAAGRTDRARANRGRAAAIEKGIEVLWDEKAGAFLAATDDCRQIDIWGNAYVLWAGFPLGDRRAAILRFLSENLHRYERRGQIRHLLEGEHWERLLVPVEKGRYQNGAYWATASGWVMAAVAEVNPAQARKLFADLMADFDEGDICECIGADGHRQLPSYVASATNPLGAALRLWGGAAAASAMGETGPPKAGKSPADDLPPHIRRLTWFGERADWSHDGKKILFVAKTYGDVYEVEVATGIIRPVTHHFHHGGFTRALYLASGDILLSGCTSFDAARPHQNRTEKAELWLLDRSLAKPPVRLGEKCSEGPAVSRKRMRIAWTVVDVQEPERLAKGQSQIWMADVEAGGGGARLAGKRLVLDSAKLPFRSTLECQNFRPPDERELTFSAYGFQGTEVMGVDLETGKVTNWSSAPDQYDEPEGIFPDGKWTLVESDRHNKGGWQKIDIWKLALDGSGRMERLTRFSDSPGFKASNPVVSDDGRRMAFQMARTDEPAGVGHGIFVYDLPDSSDR